jgi:hypothetical protein
MFSTNNCFLKKDTETTGAAGGVAGYVPQQ